MIFRDAREEDWPAIEALLVACALPLDGAREHLADFIVCERGEIVGCAGAEVYGDAALLRSVAVGNDARGSGIGTRLTTSILSRLQARGVRTVALLTTTAEAYFTKQGFVAAPRSAIPEALHVSAELKEACPATAVAMLLRA